MSTKKRQAYAGDLIKKIAIKQPSRSPVPKTGSKGRSSDLGDSISANWHIPLEWLEKMNLLLSHYRIDRDNPERWFGLALCLAIDHVPGFEPVKRKKPGAKLDWDGVTLARLNFQVSGLIASRQSASIRAACETILADSNLRRAYPIGPNGKPVSVPTLMRKYHDSNKDPLVKMLQRIGADNAENQLIVIEELLEIR